MLVISPYIVDEYTHDDNTHIPIPSCPFFSSLLARDAFGEIREGNNQKCGIVSVSVAFSTRIVKSEKVFYTIQSLIKECMKIKTIAVHHIDYYLKTALKKEEEIVGLKKLVYRAFSGKYK